MPALTIYRPILNGLDEVNFFAKKVAEDLDIDGSDDAHVQWGSSPRAVAMMATGELAEYLSRSPFVPQVGRFMNKAGMSATTRLWGSNLSDKPVVSDETKRMISLAQNIREGYPEDVPFTPEEFDEVALKALRSAQSMGIPVRSNLWTRAGDVSTFQPFPLLDGSSTIRHKFADYRRDLDDRELPVLEFGPLTMSVSNNEVSQAVWSNYGVIPNIENRS